MSPPEAGVGTTQAEEVGVGRELAEAAAVGTELAEEAGVVPIGSAQWKVQRARQGRQ